MIPSTVHTVAQRLSSRSYTDRASLRDVTPRPFVVVAAALRCAAMVHHHTDGEVTLKAFRIGNQRVIPARYAWGPSVWLCLRLWQTPRSRILGHTLLSVVSLLYHFAARDNSGSSVSNNSLALRKCLRTSITNQKVWKINTGKIIYFLMLCGTYTIIQSSSCSKSTDS